MVDQRMEQMSEFSARLRENKTPKPVFDAITYGIHQWYRALQVQTAEPIRPWQPRQEYDNKYIHLIEPTRRAFQSQTEIGWNNFMRGRISSLWLDTIRLSQPAEKIPTGSTTSFKPTTWSRALIKSSWELFENLWMTRNGIIHGEDQETAMTIARDSLVDQVTTAFNFGRHTTLPADHTGLFNVHTLETLTTKSNQYLRCWLASYKVATNTWQQINDGRVNNPVDRGPTQTTLHRFGIDQSSV